MKEKPANKSLLAELATRINFEIGLLVEELELLADKRDELRLHVKAMHKRGENLEKIQRLLADNSSSSTSSQKD